jgi:alpha-glucosidase
MLSRWDPKESKEFAKLTSALLLSLKGTPCLYQGEELGQTETELEFKELTDPPGIRYWPENKGRDGCRTPMTWNRNSLNAGFSTFKPWLPVKEKQKLNSVNIQEEDNKSILNFYKEFLDLRRKRNESPRRRDRISSHPKKMF